MRLSAIYKIVNNSNDKYYVGSSINVNKRWNEHKYLLKKGVHHNDYLQRSWNKYGESNFNFIVIDKLDPNISELDLLIEEQKWLNIAKNDPKSYNLTFVANNPNVLLSEYSKKKRSESLKKVIKTKEWKEKISKSHIGKHHSEYSKGKMRLAKIGKKQLRSHIDNATKSRTKDWTFISPTGDVVYIHNLKSFCKENKLHSGGMYWVASGKKKQYKGWKKS